MFLTDIQRQFIQVNLAMNLKSKASLQQKKSSANLDLESKKQMISKNPSSHQLSNIIYKNELKQEFSFSEIIKRKEEAAKEKYMLEKQSFYRNIMKGKTGEAKYNGKIFVKDLQNLMIEEEKIMKKLVKTRKAKQQLINYGLKYIFSSNAPIIRIQYHKINQALQEYCFLNNDSDQLQNFKKYKKQQTQKQLTYQINKNQKLKAKLQIFFKDGKNQHLKFYEQQTNLLLAKTRALEKTVKDQQKKIENYEKKLKDYDNKLKSADCQVASLRKQMQLIRKFK